MRESTAAEYITWEKGCVIVFPQGSRFAYVYPAQSWEYALFFRVKSVGSYWNRAFVRTARPFEKLTRFEYVRERAAAVSSGCLTANQKMLCNSFNVVTNLV